MKPLYHIIMNNTTKIATIQNRDDAYNLCEILRCCQRVYSKIKTKDKPYILRYEFCVVQSPNRDDDRIYRMSTVTGGSKFAKIIDEEIDYFIEYNGCAILLSEKVINKRYIRNQSMTLRNIVYI